MLLSQYFFYCAFFFKKKNHIEKYVDFKMLFIHFLWIRKRKIPTFDNLFKKEKRIAMSCNYHLP